MPLSKFSPVHILGDHGILPFRSLREEISWTLSLLNGQGWDLYKQWETEKAHGKKCWGCLKFHMEITPRFRNNGDRCVEANPEWRYTFPIENSMVEQSFDDGINMKQRPSEEDQSEKKWRIHKTLFNLWNLYAADQ